MISSLISLLIVALVLFLIFYLTGLFMDGIPHKIVGIILGLILLLYALRRFGIALPAFAAALLLTSCAGFKLPPIKGQLCYTTREGEVCVGSDGEAATLRFGDRESAQSADPSGKAPR